MDRAGWDARYRTIEPVWPADPNRLLVAEAAELSPVTAFELGAEEGRNAPWPAGVHRTVETGDGEGMAVDALVGAHRPEQW